MKNYLFAATLWLLLPQCQSDTSTEPTTQTQAEADTGDVKFGQEFTLQQLDQITVYGGDAPRKLHLSAQQLNDSRCPQNASCITAGNASVVLSASNSQGKNENIQLCLGGCSGGQRSTHSVTAAVGETVYIFRLVAVTPFPELNKQSTPVAKLIVEKVSG